MWWGVCICESRNPQSPKEEIRCPGVGTIDGCWPLDVNARSQTPVLSKSNICS